MVSVHGDWVARFVLGGFLEDLGPSLVVDESASAVLDLRVGAFSGVTQVILADGRVYLWKLKLFLLSDVGCMFSINLLFKSSLRSELCSSFNAVVACQLTKLFTSICLWRGN